MELIKRIKRSLGWHIYWDVARWLPPHFMRGGCFSKWLRATCCRQFLAYVGKGVNIESRVYFGTDAVRIGDYSGFGVRCNVYGAVTMGDHVMMGPDCDIFSRNHRFNRVDTPMDTQGFSESRMVSIGSDVWIGSRVIILPGVKIGNGVVVGAGSVVTKDIPDYAVAVGNPAKVKKFRK